MPLGLKNWSNIPHAVPSAGPPTFDEHIFPLSDDVSVLIYEDNETGEAVLQAFTHPAGGGGVFGPAVRLYPRLPALAHNVGTSIVIPADDGTTATPKVGDLCFIAATSSGGGGGGGCSSTHAPGPPAGWTVVGRSCSNATTIFQRICYLTTVYKKLVRADLGSTITFASPGASTIVLASYHTGASSSVVATQVNGTSGGGGGDATCNPYTTLNADQLIVQMGAVDDNGNGGTWNVDFEPQPTDLQGGTYSGMYTSWVRATTGPNGVAIADEVIGPPGPIDICSCHNSPGPSALHTAVVSLSPDNGFHGWSGVMFAGAFAGFAYFFVKFNGGVGYLFKVHLADATLTMVRLGSMAVQAGMPFSVDARTSNGNWCLDSTILPTLVVNWEPLNNHVDIVSLDKPSGFSVSETPNLLVDSSIAHLYSACPVDSTHLLLVYVDTASPANVKAVVLTFTATTVTFGTPVTLMAGVGAPQNTGAQPNYGVFPLGGGDYLMPIGAAAWHFFTVHVSGTTVTLVATDLTTPAVHAQGDQVVYDPAGFIYLPRSAASICDVYRWAGGAISGFLGTVPIPSTDEAFIATNRANSIMSWESVLIGGQRHARDDQITWLGGWAVGSVLNKKPALGASAWTVG